MPKIAELPEIHDLTGDELVVLERAATTGRAQIGSLLTSIMNRRLRLPDGRMEVATIGMQKPVRPDLYGDQGGGPAIYVPLSLISINAPRLGFNLGIQPLNPECVEMPGYAKISLASSEHNVATDIYFDGDTQLFDVAVYPDRPSAENGFIPMLSVFAGCVTGYDGVNIQPVPRSVEPLKASTVTMKQKIVIDRKGNADGLGGAAVYVPLGEIYVNMPTLGINLGYEPLNQEAPEMPGYTRFNLSSASPSLVAQIYFNIHERLYYGSIYPDIPSARNGFIPVVNIWADLAAAFPGVEVISYDEYKLGTQSWPDICATTAEIIDDDDDVIGGGRAFYMQPRFYQARGFEDADFTANNPESVELPGYIKILKTPRSDLQHLAFNMNNGMVESYPYTILKTTFAQAGASVVSILTSWEGQVHTKFPVRKTIAADKPITGAHLFLIEGRPLPFYPQTLYGDRQAVDRRVTTLGDEICGPTHWLRAEDFGASTTLVSRTNSIDTRDLATRYHSDMTVLKGPPNGSGPLVVAPMGDSMDDFDLFGWLGIGLTDFGYDADLIGTLNTAASGPYKDEGRAGWQIADFTGENNRYPAIPDTPEDWAAYLNLSDAEKHLHNPYLRRALPSDPVDRVFRGLDGLDWIYDYGFYLRRTGFPIPDVVPITAGTNDVYQAGGLAAADRIVRSFNNVLDSIRAAAPNAITLIVQVGYGRSKDQDDRWANEVRWAQVATLKNVNAFRRANGDTKNFYVAAYQHQNPETNYPTRLAGTDLLSGTQTRHMDDSLHPNDAGRRQIANAVIAAIHACRHIGYAGQSNAALIASLEGVGLQGTGMLPTLSILGATNIPAAVMRILCHSRVAVGDGGGQWRKRGANMTGAVQSLDGAWWELDEDQPDPRMFSSLANFNLYLASKGWSGTAPSVWRKDLPPQNLTLSQAGLVPSASGSDAANNRGALQALIDWVSALSNGGTIRGGDYDAKFGSEIYCLDQTIILKPRVNFDLGQHTVLRASAAMSAMFDTATGTSNRLRNTDLSGGVFDGDGVADRIFRFRDYQNLNLTKVRALSALVAAIHLDTAAASKNCYELNISHCKTGCKSGIDSTTAVALLASAGVSDTHILRTVFEGYPIGVQGYFYETMMHMVHTWSFPNFGGAHQIGFKLLGRRVNLSKCQVDDPHDVAYDIYDKGHILDSCMYTLADTSLDMLTYMVRLSAAAKGTRVKSPTRNDAPGARSLGVFQWPSVDAFDVTLTDDFVNVGAMGMDAAGIGIAEPDIYKGFTETFASCTTTAGAVPTIIDSTNIASIVRNADGDYTFNLKKKMRSADLYTVNVDTPGDLEGLRLSKGTTNFRVVFRNNSGVTTMPASFTVKASR